VKRIISMLLVVSILLMSTFNAYAAGHEDHKQALQDLDLSRYDTYTIVLDESVIEKLSNTTEMLTREDRWTIGNTIEDAIGFVKSLGLDDQDTSYIKEACLDELEIYKEKGINLIYYTVLVPKENRSELVYGTYNGNTFYYSLTSLASFVEDYYGDACPSQTIFDDWALGIVEFLISFAGTVLSLPYAIVSASMSSLGGNHTLHYTDFYRYQVNYYSMMTRVIYAYSGATKKTLLKGQRTNANITAYYVEVGNTTGGSPVEEYLGKTLLTQYYNNKSRNLQKAYTFLMHGGMETRTILNELNFHEVWTY